MTTDSRVSITDTFIDRRAIRRDGQQQTYYWSSKVPGFGLCVNAGSKKFVVQALSPKTQKTQRYHYAAVDDYLNDPDAKNSASKVGKYDIDRAEEDARRLLAKIRAGESLTWDTGKTGRLIGESERQKGITLAEVTDLYIRNRLSHKGYDIASKDTKGSAAYRFASDIESRLKRHLSRYWEKPIAELAAADLSKVRDGIRDQIKKDDPLKQWEAYPPTA